MLLSQYYSNLTPPKGKIDVVLDTDAYNEIDDQYAISYMIKHSEKFNVKGICAAPFQNSNASSPEIGMEKSYMEILHLLELMNEDALKKCVYKGSKEYLKDENTPIDSDAAQYLADVSNEYKSAKPLYIVAIGAITNVASAILKNPAMIENCVVVWLGGHGVHIPSAASEFNMRQDIAAARVLMGCGIPLVLVPCAGVVDRFYTTKPELEYWLKGKNSLCDYLVEHTVQAAESYAAGRPWARVIWDVVAVAWLLNRDNKFMEDCLIPSPIPEYDEHYAMDPNRHMIKYVHTIYRVELFDDLFKTISKKIDLA